MVLPVQNPTVMGYFEPTVMGYSDVVYDIPSCGGSEPETSAP